MKTKLFFLTILFSFGFSNIKAQCPEGDVELRSQEDVFLFVTTYPNCTHITGDLRFGYHNNGHTSSNDINDISGFDNLIKIDGALGVYGTDLISLNGMNNLTEFRSLNIIDNNHLESIANLINITTLDLNQLLIHENPNLQSLEGLDNLQTINGRFYLNMNDSLQSLSNLSNLSYVGGLFFIANTNVANLDGLENLEFIGERLIIAVNPILEDIEGLNNLTFVGGDINIANNPLLTSLSGIQNFPISTEGDEIGIRLADNDNLTQCNLPNICDYLELNSTEYPREIFGNSGNCINEQAVLAACGLGISDMENESANWNVHYQKNTGGFLIQTDGFKMSDIEVYDLSGKLLNSAQNLNSEREEIRVFTPETILIIKVKTKDGKSFAKKVMMK